MTKLPNTSYYSNHKGYCNKRVHIIKENVYQKLMHEVQYLASALYITLLKGVSKQDTVWRETLAGGKIGELLVICQTKSIQISTHH